MTRATAYSIWEASGRSGTVISSHNHQGWGLSFPSPSAAYKALSDAAGTMEETQDPALVWEEISCISLLLVNISSVEKRFLLQ